MPVAAPLFSVASGTYSTSQTVALSQVNWGSVIYYTTDGSTPTTNSTKYTAPITVPATTPSTVIIQAIATLSGYAPSTVSSATYLMAPPAATPTFSPVAGSYSAAQTLTLACATSGATIYYTTTGVVPTTSSTKYTAAFKVSATATVEAIAIAPGYSTSAVATAKYTIKSAIIRSQAGLILP
jgi:hypothetical protein